MQLNSKADNPFYQSVLIGGCWVALWFFLNFQLLSNLRLFL